ncbi:MAG: hypothetical protein HZA32_14495 [Opitutae bacterium]|nr:hypothetical protein [Opitutae bacterium]
MKRLAIALFSTGWLVPAWLGVSSIMTILDAEVWPLLRGGHPANSFPFVGFGTRCFAISFLWLATVIVFWSWQLAPLVLAKKEAIQPLETTRGV